MTSCRFSAPTTTPRITATIATRTCLRSSSCLPARLKPSWGSSMPVRQPLRLALGISLGTTSAQVLKKTKTTTKKTVKMLRQYHEVIKMPKRWAHVKEEKIQEEITELWRRQRTALSNSTTHGRCNHLACSIVSPPSLQGST